MGAAWCFSLARPPNTVPSGAGISAAPLARARVPHAARAQGTVPPPPPLALPPPKTSPERPSKPPLQRAAASAHLLSYRLASPYPYHTTPHWPTLASLAPSCTELPHFARDCHSLSSWFRFIACPTSSQGTERRRRSACPHPTLGQRPGLMQPARCLRRLRSSCFAAERQRAATPRLRAGRTPRAPSLAHSRPLAPLVAAGMHGGGAARGRFNNFQTGCMTSKAYICSWRAGWACGPIQQFSASREQLVSRLLAEQLRCQSVLV
jgi:hypothetical protein